MRNMTFEKEKSVWKKGISVIGIDEVGRGPLAGPVVAAAACYKNTSYDIPKSLGKMFRLVRDSKTLSPGQREKMDVFVREHFLIGIGMASVEEIDRINILQASLLAMKQAIINLQLTTDNQQLRKNIQAGEILVLVDGNHLIPNLNCKQEAIVSGDSICKSIAAASIVAKVARDRLVSEYDALYPVYGFSRHKGYGTKEHLEALRKHGPCPHHRMSFQPVLLTNPENVNKKFANVLKPK